MRNSTWKLTDSLPGEYTQLRLFPPTETEVLIARVNELESKLDRQRKSQFAKIGALQKKYDELLADMEIIKRGICRQNSACEIVDIAVM